MDPNEAVELNQEQTPVPATYEELAGRMESMLLDPLATDEQVAQLCRDAAELGLAAVFVRPGDLDLAATQLKGSGTAVGSVCGYPHGWPTTAVKMFEVRDMLRRGAREVMAVAPVGRLVSRQFQAVESEVLQMARACHEEGARFRLVLDAGLLAEDLKLIGMKIAKRCEADLVQVTLDASEAIWTEAPVYKRTLKWFCGLAAPSPSDTLEDVLRLYGLDAVRIQCGQARGVLTEWRRRLAEQAAMDAAKSPSE